jgi:ubiquinone biosynthesis protein
MERVEGFGGECASGAEARAALAAAVRALYRMIFVEGCIHCDLHRGNLGLIPGGRAAIVDFGFVAEIGDQARKNFARFFFAMATNDGATCARITRNTALSVPPELDYAAFRAEVVALVDGVARAPAREFRVAGFVGRLFEVQRRHGLRGTNAFVMPILALLVLEGIVNEVDPGFDFQAEALPYVLHAAVRPTVGSGFAG